MPLAFFQERHSADLMSRVVVDASRLARLSSEVLVMAFRQVCTVIALLAVMVTQETRLTLLALVAFPMVGLTIRGMGRRLYSINRGTQEQIAALERVSGLSAEDAKSMLLEAVRAESEHDAVKLARAIERSAREEAQDKARDIILTAMQRVAADHTAKMMV